ncbi:L,D-transpeptidase, partial [Chamaesiphon sp. OTE_20_metabat_361]
MLTIIPTRLFAETQDHRRNSPPPALIAQIPTKPTPAPTTKAPQKLEPLSSPANSNNPATPNKSTGTSPTSTTKPAVAATGKPTEEVVSLVLKLREKRVYVYRGDKLLKRYPVAIGKKGWETPTGEWQVMEKIKNPAWTSFKTGEVFPPGVENPLGSRWIGFW